MDALLAIAVIVSALFAWFSFFSIIPRNLEAICRYRLWEIRDELVDDVRAGKFKDEDEPRKVQYVIEAFIEAASELTPLRLGLMMAISRRHDNRVKLPAPISLKGLCRGDKERLGAYIVRFNSAITWRVLLGSPSGWALTLASVPLVLLALLIDLFRRDGNILDRTQQRVARFSWNGISAGHYAEDHPVYGEHHAVSQFAN